MHKVGTLALLNRGRMETWLSTILICYSVGFDSNPAAGDDTNCALYKPGGFVNADDMKTHYAFLTEAPTADHPDDEIKLCTTECPGSNNQVYTTPYGKVRFLRL